MTIWEIAYAIKKYRRDNNMTQGDLAAYLNNKCTIPMISDWENLKHAPGSRWVKIMRDREVL